MIRRPLNSQFNTAILADRKRTTIRNKPWPVGKTIQLYNWSGAAYRSKQIEVTVITVLWTAPITIERIDDRVLFYINHLFSKPLWILEGFDSQKSMHDWFLAKLKKGQRLQQHLMCFRRVTSELPIA